MRRSSRERAARGNQQPPVDCVTHSLTVEKNKSTEKKTGSLFASFEPLLLRVCGVAFFLASSGRKSGGILFRLAR